MFKKFIIIMLIGVAHPAALAEKIGSGRFDQSDMALLPKYCQDKIQKRNVNHWKSIFNKKDWASGHHYCFGLVYLDRSKAGKVKGNLHNAIANLNTADKAWSQSFVLRPQLFVNLGEAYEIRGADSVALEYYHKAIKLKPNYSYAYLKLSSYYEKKGMHAEAIRVLEDGVQKASKSKALKRKLEQLKK